MFEETKQQIGIVEVKIFVPRISAGECEFRDMEWYGVDRQGNIAVFCSGGVGNLPEFICESEERADELMEYFEKIPKSTNSILRFPKTKIGRTEQAAKDFSDKGLYYFDSDDGIESGVATLHQYYTKHSHPEKPLKYDLLPKHIREILKYNFMEIEDFSLVDTIHTKHAYV